MNASEPTRDITTKGAIIQRLYCPNCWRTHGERTVVDRGAIFESECCGWTLPRSMVRTSSGFAEPNARGRLEVYLSRKDGQP